MKKIDDNPFLFLFFMGAFAAMMLFGLIWGPKHPQIFFWGIIILTVAIVSIYVAPTKKETIRLLTGVALCTIIGSTFEYFVRPLFGKHSLSADIVCILLLASVYIPTLKLYLRVCVRHITLTQKNDANPDDTQNN